MPTDCAEVTVVVLTIIDDAAIERMVVRFLEGSGHTVVSVADPLSLKSPQDEPRPLILGAYVRVEITGPDLAKAVRLPRTALRDGRRVWVMKPDETLDVRKVTIAWGANEDIYVSKGLADGELLITSDLGAPVQGMALRLPAGGGGASSRPATGPAPAQGPEAGP